ncbi:MAG TPA: YtcA family lipoprotein [Verrucomicrobiae bacterium]|nr:YtcA family lipoprotein [Verrucomicrobiae bacterium]
MSVERQAGAMMRRLLLPLTAWTLAGCSRAPSVDILGSFFPAWLLCLTTGILLALVARWMLSWFHTNLAMPVLAYPSLAVLLTLAMWLVFFR